MKVTPMTALVLLVVNTVPTHTTQRLPNSIGVGRVYPCRMLQAELQNILQEPGDKGSE